MKYKKSVYRALTLITQFGIDMLVPIFACSFVGIFLDKQLGTSFYMVILFFIGALAGFRNVYIFAKKIYMSKDEDVRHGRSNRKENSISNKQDK